MGTYKEDYEEKELEHLILSIGKMKFLLTQRDEYGFFEESMKNIVLEFSLNPRLRDFVK